MNLRHLRYLLLIACLHLCSIAVGQNMPQLQSYLDIDSGLSNNSVNAIFEDSRGYLWVGTSVGLNRYDGYDVEVYKNRLGEEQMCSNLILSIEEDALGRLWLGTDSGVEILDFDMGNFLNIQGRSTTNTFIETSRIVAIEPCDEGRRMICATRDNGLLIYDLKAKLIRNVNDRWIDIVKFKALDDHHYIVATRDRLSIYNSDTQECMDVEGVFSNKQDDLRDVEVLDSSIYVVLHNGIKHIEYNWDRGQIQYEVKDKLYYPNERLKHISIDHSGRVLITMLKGGIYSLSSIEKLGAEMTPISTSLQVSTIEDMGDNIYVGSQFSGLFSLSSRGDIFSYHQFGSAANFRISSIVPYDDHSVFVKNRTYGILLYDLEKGCVVRSGAINSLPMFATPFVYSDGELYAFDTTIKSAKLIHWQGGKWHEIKSFGGDVLKPESISSLWKDNRGYVWFSSKERITRLQIQESLSRLKIVDVEGEKRYTLQSIELPLISSKLHKIRGVAFDDSNDRVWVGSSTQGLYCIDGVSDLPIKLSQITQIYNDGDQSLTDHEITTIPSNFVSSMEIIGDELYVGNYMGLFRGGIADGKPLFRVYTKESGLPSDAIKGIVADAQGRLFVSTLRGISIFDPQSETISSYGAEDGLPINSFSDVTSKIGDHTIIMCATNSAVAFNPQSIDQTRAIPNIEFGELRLFNERIKPCEKIDGRVVIGRRLMDGDTIRLNYKSNMLSFDLRSLHFSNPQHFAIRYRIGNVNERERDDKEWLNRRSDNNTISLSELSHGTYWLEFAGANSNGEWGASKSLTIIIDPPLWLTWWAYLIYAVLILALAYVVLRFFLRMQSLRHAVEMESVLNRKEREKQRYLSNIAHEIKTPLSMVVSAVDTLYDHYNYDNEIGQQLKLVQRQGYKISKMMDTIQSIYINELGFLHPRLTTFDVKSMLNPIIEDFKYLSSSQQKSLSVVAPAEDIFVRADTSMLERVVHNILNNACKYTQNGGEIELSWSRKGADLVIAVKDNGIGISPEEVKHIFERYYRSEDVRTESIIQGNGIGLEFSRQLVLLHNGDISVESKLSEGSCFMITLPVVVDAIESGSADNMEQEVILDQINQLVPDSIDTESEFRESLIFVVEDNPELRALIVDFVGRYYNVQGYSDGSEAIEAMGELCPDLILSDVVMPNMDGYELCRRVKGGVATSHIPIILITACTSVDEKIKCREVGADIYISKPFYPKYVIACIETTLRNHKILRERFKIGVPIESANTIDNDKSNEFMDKLYAYLDENLSNDDIDINIVARQMYLNRTYFYQKVKAVTNMTPYEFIKEYRLIKASQMLTQGEKSVVEISDLVGFKNRTHFSRVFKERFGMTPSQYKKES